MSNTTELTAHQEEEWNNFKTKFERKYETPEEEQHRKSIFVKNLHKIEEHNKLYENGKVTYTMGINNFADKLQEEICCQGRKKCEKK